MPTPSFHLLERRPPRPGAVLLAIVIAASGILAVLFGLGRAGMIHHDADGYSVGRTSGGGSTGGDQAHGKEDPDQTDVIVLGDAADAPVPARRNHHVSDVHRTVLVRLPRYGEQTGLIPDTPAGHLLYRWLAAFNQASEPDLESVLPGFAPAPSGEAQMALRQQTGGFNLVSAKEIEAGVLVFRLRDQTKQGGEVLGTLHVRANSNPPAVASFSLRAADGGIPAGSP